MKSINRLTKKLGTWFSKDSFESEPPLLLQSLESRVLYSAVPLPVDSVEAPVENAELEDVQFIETESNTPLPIGQAIAEEASVGFLAQDNYSTEYTATSAEATLEDLEQLVNSIDQDDTVATEDLGPRTAMGLVEATPATAPNFFVLQEGQSFTIDFELLGNPTESFLGFGGQGFTLFQPPTSGLILVNGEPLEVGVGSVSPLEISDGQVIFVPDPSFVGNLEFTLEDNSGGVQTISLLYQGVADDGVAVLGDTFAPVDGSVSVFEANALESETRVESLSNGGYVVVSTLGASDGQVKFQIFDNDGVATSSAVSVANEQRVENLAVTAIEDGEFLVAYTSSANSGPGRLNIHRFNENGQEINFNGLPIQLRLLGFQDFNDPSITYLGEERFLFSAIESDDRGNIPTIFFNLDGTFDTTIDSFFIDNPNAISVRSDALAGGGYVLTRVENGGASNTIFASVFDPGGHFKEDIEIASGVTGDNVTVVGTSDNGFVVLWQGTSTSPNDIFAAKFDRAGNLVATELVAQVTANVSASPDVVTLADGSFVISYTTVGSDGTQEILGQRLNADLTTLGDSFTINSFSGEDQTDSDLAVLSDGTLVATFTSGDQTTPVSHFHQRLRMSVTGEEDAWIPLNSVIGIAPGSSTEVIDSIVISDLPVGSKIRTGQLDVNGNLIVKEITFPGEVITLNAFDVGPLEFMAPADTSGTIEGVVTLITNDGGDTEEVAANFQVVVNPVDDAPVIIPGQVFAINEGSILNANVAIADPDGDTPTFSLNPVVGDSRLFNITSTGVLNFINLPDFEVPLDDGADNFYEVAVVVDDGSGNSVQETVTVAVQDVNELHVFTSPTTFDVVEGNTVVGQVIVNDPENEPIAFSIIPGVGDGDLFSISGDGEISFLLPPDFENPISNSGTNQYTLTVVADDNRGQIVETDITVRVTDALNDGNVLPVIGPVTGFTIFENETNVDVITSFDQDGDTVILSVVPGLLDGDLFQIASDGTLSFISPPDFENSLSSSIENIYTLSVRADDQNGGISQRVISVEVLDRNEAPIFVGNDLLLFIQQNESRTETFELADLFVDPEDSNLTLEIAGGADANLFHVVSNELALIDAPEIIGSQSPNFEVEILATDGENDSMTQTINLRVNNINDRPEITDITPVIDSLEVLRLSQVATGTIVADLNQAIIFDSDGDPLSIRLDSVGNDNGLFFIDGNNQLQLASTPLLGSAEQRDFEVSVVASDGRLVSASEAFSITIQNDINVPAVITVPVVTEVNEVTDELGVDVVGITNNVNLEIERSPQQPIENIANTPNTDDTEDSDRPDVVSTVTSVINENLTPQPVSQLRSDISGITAIDDSKIGDDDAFFDLTSNSVSYVFPSDAHRPQLVTQEIGDTTKVRSAVGDLRLEESMLASYFWQGFEDSEDDFIRKNLKVDNAAIVAASAGLSLGLVSYFRLAAMATTVVTQLPAWKTLDVAPLIAEFDEEEAETIHQIVDG